MHNFDLFPLIPLLIKEAIRKLVLKEKATAMFPLIPLLIKEAIWEHTNNALKCNEMFPLIPLLIKEAMLNY